MPKTRLSILIEKPFAQLVDKSWLRRAVELTLVCANVSSTVEVELVITGDTTIRKLNRTYRGVDRTTDVIAFALSQSANKEAESFIMPPDGVIHLGEIVISYPQAKRQAEEQRHTLECELALLIAHGVLHLLGYDHELPEDKKKMRALETKILNEIETKK